MTRVIDTGDRFRLRFEAFHVIVLWLVYFIHDSPRVGDPGKYKTAVQE